MKKDKTSGLYQAIRDSKPVPLINPDLAYKYGKASGQRDYSPVDPQKQALPELDNSPDAVEARTDEARKSLLVPLAVILGAIAVFAIAILVRTHS